MTENFKNEMPIDEAQQTLRVRFLYEYCTQHCIPKGGLKTCKGIDRCITEKGFTNPKPGEVKV
jgi:hypothetical protein